MTARLQLHPWQCDDDLIELAATFHVGSTKERLWYRVPRAHEEALTSFADPFIIGFVFQMMAAGHDVEVEGPASRSLLANLETYMDVWQTWVPASYRRVRVWTKEEAEPPPPREPDGFVMPFSAGVDSCFTALRHARGNAGRNTRRLALGLTMFGFDIRPGQVNASPMYAQLSAGAGAMLASLKIPQVSLSTNFRDLSSLWLHSHGSHLASALALFGGGYGGALIPNSLPVKHLGVLWGSHPFTDPFLSSDAFRIIDDGGAVARWQKVAALREWPEALQHLRVCFGESGKTGTAEGARSAFAPRSRFSSTTWFHQQACPTA